MLRFRSKDTIVINGLIEAAVYITGKLGTKNTLIRIQMVKTAAAAADHLRSPASNVAAIFVDADQLGLEPALSILDEIASTPETKNVTLIVWTANRTRVPQFRSSGALVLRRPRPERQRHRQISEAVAAYDRGGSAEVRRALESDLFPTSGPQ